MSRLALAIDMERCIGCKSCEAACKQEHGLGPHEYRNKVLWLETPGAPAVDLLTVACQHCERPACLRACPVHPKAIRKDPDSGVVSVDEGRCTGCGECVIACPYGAMGFDPVDHHAVKCDLCAERRARGDGPACAAVCPGHAIQFGDRESLAGAARAEGRAILDQDHYLMGPATVYLAPQRRARASSDAAPHQVALLADARSRAALANAPVEAPYRTPRAARAADRVVPGACTVCFNGCPVKYHLRGGRVVGVSGNGEDPVFRGRICPKSQMMLQLYNNARRLTRPLKRVGPRGAGRLEPVSWEQALDEIAEKLCALRDRHGPETLAVFSGTRSGIITNYGYLRIFAQMWGTPNVESTEPLCSSSKNLSYALVQGSRLMSNSYTPNDIGAAELLLYVGDNQAETRPVYFGMVNDWRKRTGGRMVVVDPRASTTAGKADLWLPIRPGTDMALGLAMINHIFARGLHDARFCERWVEGWERWRDFVDGRGYTPAWAAAVTDIAAESIEALAEEVAAADGCMIFASRGLNQHSNGTQTNRVFMFLAAMTGNWGRRGGGYLNMSSTQFVRADAPEARRAEIRRPAIGRTPVAWLEAMTEGTPYSVTALVCANNPFIHWPSQAAVREAVRALELVVHLGLVHNETCELADYVLPVALGVEKGGLSRAADDRRLVWNDRLVDPPGEARTDGWIWIELGKRLGFTDVLKEEYKDTATFWDAVCTDNDALRGATTERLRARPNRTVRIPFPAANAPELETLHLEGTTAFGEAPGKRFATPSGKLEFWTEAQERAFTALGLSALPEFYSEREQLVDLPYVALDEGPAATIAPHLFAERDAYARAGRVVAPSASAPGARLRARGFDTELVTGRPPAPHFHSWTHDLWQAQEMWPDLYVQIHPDKAAAIGIADGERVRIETAEGAIDARAWIREGIRASTVYVPIGWGEGQPFHPWRSVNFLTDHRQRDPLADQTNLKTRLCRVSRAS